MWSWCSSNEMIVVAGLNFKAEKQSLNDGFDTLAK